LSIRDNLNEVLGALYEIREKFFKCDEGEKEIFYYNIRSSFNRERKELENTNKERFTAMMIFLNKTCYGGMYRINSEGEFNSPYGEGVQSIFNEDNLVSVSKYLKNVNILCCDYREIERYITKNTFMYLDPPYRPIGSKGNFNGYINRDFNSDSTNIEMRNWVKKVSNTGCKIMMSNSDGGDGFFEREYCGFNISRISANRAINSVSSKRGKINEIVICNY
jgi:DNA adenine methylase